MNTIAARDKFETPASIFNQLDKVFSFTTDAACSSHNMKCPEGFCDDQGKDGLSESWNNRRVFCNPPYSQKKKWIQKAIFEVEQNNCYLCVMLLPLNSMSASFWHECILGKYHYEIIKGRVQFIKPGTTRPDPVGNNTGSAIVYFRRAITLKGVA